MSNKSRKSKEVVIDYFYNWPCGHEEKLGGEGDFFSDEPNLIDHISIRQNLGSPGYECPVCNRERFPDPWFDTQLAEQPGFDTPMAEPTRLGVTAALEQQLDEFRYSGTYVRIRREISQCADALQSELNNFKLTGTYARSLQDPSCSDNYGYRIPLSTQAETKKLIEQLEAALSSHRCNRQAKRKDDRMDFDPPTARRREPRSGNERLMEFESQWQVVTERLAVKGQI